MVRDCRLSSVTLADHSSFHGEEQVRSGEREGSNSMGGQKLTGSSSSLAYIEAGKIGVLF